MPLIDLRHIDKEYRVGDVKVPVLTDVSLTIEAGEFVALMGASGSGKTTLMNLLGCLDKPTQGSYRLSGVEVGRLSRTQLAQFAAAASGSSFRASTCCPAPPRSRTSACPRPIRPSNGLAAESANRAGTC